MAGKILIVEDDRAISHSLARLLGREGYYVTTWRSAEEALVHLREDATYDLALLDVMLPGQDGFACCRRMRDQGWRGSIIMLTGRDGSPYKVTGLSAGADDYIVKPFEPNELLARITAQLRRTREYDAPSQESDTVILGPGLVLHWPSHQVRRDDVPVPLTEREYELLALLARHPGTALDKTWLYQQIWGGASEDSIKVLAVYVRRLRRKIEVDVDDPQIIQTVRGFGYKLSAESPLEN